jgi:hypothetical protein
MAVGKGASTTPNAGWKGRGLLLSAIVGVSRFVFMGSLLALVYRGAPARALLLPAAAVAAAVRFSAYCVTLITESRR